MNRNQEKKKKIRDDNYWQNKLKRDREYDEAEEKWRKELLDLNPEVPKPFKR